MEEDQDIRDSLDEPIAADVAFRFVSVPLSGPVYTLDVPMWSDGIGTTDYFDEFGPRKKTHVIESDLDSCFFAPNTNLIRKGERLPTHTLPEGLYCNEFLKLDPFDIQDLLAFQRRYGRILGARERKPYGTELRELIRPEPDHNVFSGINAEIYGQQLLGIKASQRLYDSIPSEEMVDDRSLNKLGAVSFREAISAVLDAQDAVRSLIRVLRKDLGILSKRELYQAKTAASYVALFLPRCHPSIDLVVTGTQENRACDLIDGIFTQLARGLLTNDAYRACANPECGRIFTPREMNRRLDTQYCSSACQERAKRLRYEARHAK